MKEYHIQIEEILVKTVTVEAESIAQACESVERRWKDSEYILDAEIFQRATFTPLNTES